MTTAGLILAIVGGFLLLGGITGWIASFDRPRVGRWWRLLIVLGVSAFVIESVVLFIGYAVTSCGGEPNCYEDDNELGGAFLYPFFLLFLLPGALIGQWVGIRRRRAEPANWFEAPERPGGRES